LNSRVAISRAVFWVASAAAAAYWLLLSWRAEQALWDLIAWLAFVSDSVAKLLLAIDATLATGFIAVTYAFPPLFFALGLRLMHVQVDRRTWAIPATGFVLLVVFLGSESLLLGGGLLDLLRVSTFTDASWTAVGAALWGLLLGSMCSWMLLAPKGDGADRLLSPTPTTHSR